MASIKPKLIVFDLDCTLWPFGLDTPQVTLPFRKDSKGNIIDCGGSKIKSFPEVPGILKDLHTEGYTLGVASRTPKIQGANQLLELFGWNKYLTYKEIFPGCKVTHFENFKRKSNLDYIDMIFFDDEIRNIDDISRLKVASILVKNGVTHKVVSDGLKQYQRLHSS